MEEKFEWIDNGVFVNKGDPIFKKTFEKTIYDEGGCELIALFQVTRFSGSYSVWFTSMAKPRPPPMLNVRMKIIRQGFYEPCEPHESQKHIMFEKELNCDENFWIGGSSDSRRADISYKDKLISYKKDEEDLTYKFFITFKFVKPTFSFKSSVEGPTFQDLLTDSKIMDETSDFKFVCQGEELKCHKLVLSLRSDFFKTMFNSEYKESNEGMMITADFPAKTMKSFLKYLYTDSIDHVEIDYDLLRAAHLYDFKKLISECVRGLSVKINVDNVKDILQLARLLELPTLLEVAKKKMEEKLQNWRENENKKREEQINQLLGAMKIGQDPDMEGFDEPLKAQLDEYLVEIQKE